MQRHDVLAINAEHHLHVLGGFADQRVAVVFPHSEGGFAELRDGKNLRADLECQILPRCQSVGQRRLDPFAIRLLGTAIEPFRLQNTRGICLLCPRADMGIGDEKERLGALIVRLVMAVFDLKHDVTFLKMRRQWFANLGIAAAAWSTGKGGVKAMKMTLLLQRHRIAENHAEGRDGAVGGEGHAEVHACADLRDVDLTAKEDLAGRVILVDHHLNGIAA